MLQIQTSPDNQFFSINNSTQKANTEITVFRKPQKFNKTNIIKFLIKVRKFHKRKNIIYKVLI